MGRVAQSVFEMELHVAVSSSSVGMSLFAKEETPAERKKRRAATQSVGGLDRARFADASEEASEAEAAAVPPYVGEAQRAPPPPPLERPVLPGAMGNGKDRHKGKGRGKDKHKGKGRGKGTGKVWDRPREESYKGKGKGKWGQAWRMPQEFLEEDTYRNLVVQGLRAHEGATQRHEAALGGHGVRAQRGLCSFGPGWQGVGGRKRRGLARGRATPTGVLQGRVPVCSADEVSGGNVVP